MATDKTAQLEASRSAEASRLLKYQNLRSPDFYAHAEPTEKGLLADYKARQAENFRKSLETKLQREKWYGESDPDDGWRSGETYREVREEDPILKVVHALSSPLYGVVGGTAHMFGLGKGTTFGESVMKGVEEREVFGRLMRRGGMHPTVAAPLGFLLDVTLDPVNWAVLGGGTAFRRSAIGKIGEGMAKKGLTGAALATDLAATKTAYRMMTLVPGTNINKILKKPFLKLAEAGISPDSAEGVRTITTALAGGNPNSRWGKFLTKIRTEREFLALKASKKAQQFDELMDFDIYKILERRADRNSILGSVFNKMQDNPTMKKLHDFFAYDNADWYRKMKALGEFEDIAKKSGRFLGVEDSDELLRLRVNKMVDEVEKGKVFRDNINKHPDTLTKSEGRDMLRELIKRSDEIIMEPKPIKDIVPKGPSISQIASDGLDSVAREQKHFNLLNEGITETLSKENINALRILSDEISKKFSISSPRAVAVSNKIIGGFENFMGLFKTAKISSLNPQTMVNAIAGNPMMSLLSGFNPFTRASYDRLKDSFAIVSRKVRGTAAGQARAEKIQNMMLKDPIYAEFWRVHKNTFIDAVGADIEKLFLKKESVRELADLHKGFIAKRIDDLPGWKELSNVEKSKRLKIWRGQFEATDSYKNVLKESKRTAISSKDIPAARASYVRDNIGKRWLGPAPEAGTASRVRYDSAVKGLEKEFDEFLKTQKSGYGGEWNLGNLDKLSNTSQSFIAQDLRNLSSYRKLIEKTALQAETGTGLKKQLSKFHQFALKRSEDFQKVDQVYKMKDFLRFTFDGITERELLRVTNNTLATSAKIAPSDIIESYYRAGTQYFRIQPLKALEMASEIYMNYAAMPAFIQLTRNMPIFGAPFFAFCRSEDTEILTSGGFKRHKDLKVGDMAMSLNEESKKLEWKKITNIFRFNIDEDIVKIKSRSMDILCTKEHSMVMAKKPYITIGKDFDGNRIREYKDWKIFRKKAWELGSGVGKASVVCGAENGYNGSKESVPDEIVELIGWFVTEGYYTNKKKSGGYSNFQIGQSRPDGVVALFDLRRRIAEKYNTERSVQKRDKSKDPRANYDNYIFHFDSKMLNEIKQYLPGKELTISFLNMLSRRQLKLLFDVLVLADGTVDKKTNRISFNQNKGETLDSFQALCLMLGFSCSTLKKPTSKSCYQVDVNTVVYRQLKRNKPKTEKYKGVVWCPEVEDNHNWVARRNGRIDITGNSYAMLQKTGKALMNNPSSFNKINFFLNEIGKDMSPVEREAMKSKYASWLGEPGMMYLGDNMPFFKNQPMFINLTSMIPHYSLNNINASDRNMMEGARKNISVALDRSTMFKDPAGQVLLDYVLIPWIMQDQTTNLWGGPLYEREVGGFRQTAYAARQLADALIPSAVGTGLGLGMAAGTAVGLPSKAINLLPSYPGRRVAFGSLGKTPMGIDASEEPMSRGMRAILGQAGINLYPLHIGSVINELKARYGKDF